MCILLNDKKKNTYVCVLTLFCKQNICLRHQLFVSCHPACKQNICLRHQLFVSCHPSVKKTFALDISYLCLATLL